MSTAMTCSAFSGRSEMIAVSVFNLRRMKGAVRRCSRCPISSASASSRRDSMALAKWLRKKLCEPSMPGLTKSRMLRSSDSLFSIGVPVSAMRWRAGIARALFDDWVPAFLIACASSSTTWSHCTAAKSLASRARVPYEVMTMSALSAASNSSSPLSLPVPWWTRTRMLGTNRAASRAQLPTTDVGATTRVGPRFVPSASSTARRESSCSVLPSPMSSASTAPRLLRDMKYSQSTPRRWYSRRSAETVSGMSTRSGAGRSVPPTSEVNHGEPVNSIGLSAPASSASWRSSAADTTPSPSAAFRRSYSSCAC